MCCCIYVLDKSTIETNFVAQEFNVEGAESYSIIAYAVLLVLAAAMIIFDILTFGRQLGFLKVLLPI